MFDLIIVIYGDIPCANTKGVFSLRTFLTFFICFVDQNEGMVGSIRLNFSLFLILKLLKWD